MQGLFYRNHELCQNHIPTSVVMLLQQQEMVFGSTEQNGIMLQLLSGSYNNSWNIVSVSIMQYPAPPIAMMLYVSSSTVAVSTTRNQAPPFSYGYNNSWSLDFAKLYENYAPLGLMMSKQQLEHFVL